VLWLLYTKESSAYNGFLRLLSWYVLAFWSYFWIVFLLSYSRIIQLESDLLKYLFLVLSIVLGMVTLVFYCFTAFSDPGTLPRRPDVCEYTEAEKSKLIS